MKLALTSAFPGMRQSFHCRSCWPGAPGLRVRARSFDSGTFPFVLPYLSALWPFVRCKCILYECVRLSLVMAWPVAGLPGPYLDGMKAYSTACVTPKMYNNWAGAPLCTSIFDSNGLFFFRALCCASVVTVSYPLPFCYSRCVASCCQHWATR